jgi:hypothetical protein
MNNRRTPSRRDADHSIDCRTALLLDFGNTRILKPNADTT